MHTINKELTAYMVTTPTNKNGTSKCDPQKPRQKRQAKKDFLRGQMGGVIGEHKVPLSFSASRNRRIL